jgi:hypothetical protein
MTWFLVVFFFDNGFWVVEAHLFFELSPGRRDSPPEYISNKEQTLDSLNNFTSREEGGREGGGRHEKQDYNIALGFRQATQALTAPQRSTGLRHRGSVSGEGGARGAHRQRPCRSFVSSHASSREAGRSLNNH